MRDSSALPMPYRIGLSGLSLIEASAGTGKTYTLVRLMARHLLWAGLPIERVLAVTFTEAACAELKDRLRALLAQISRHLAAESDDGDIQYLLSARPEHVSKAQIQSRLVEALNNIDRAAVFTIHGFCQGVLRDQPLLTGQTIPAPELLVSEAALMAQISEEFWRQHSQDPETAAALHYELQSPQQTGRFLPVLLSLARLTPDKPERPRFEPMPSLQETLRSQGEPALLAMLSAFEAGVFYKNQFPTAASIQRCFEHLTAFLKTGETGLIKQFSKLAYGAIKEIKGKTKPDNPLLHEIERLLAWHAVQSANQQQLGLWLIHALRDFAGHRLAELKAQQQVYGFSDMIDSVHAALQGGHAEALASEIRKRYPVALVDEFQDTDERQWQIFERIYLGQQDASLLLIGDPKQAIYGFRGGDVHTYLKARSLAGDIHCLETNFRTTPALLDDIARLFTGKRVKPFYEEAIPFTPVRPGRQHAQLVVAGKPWPALQFAVLDNDSGKKVLPAGRALLRCADLAANNIAHLLAQSHDHQAVLADADGSRPVRSGDIVVLVATHRQAALMQSRLQRLQIASVCVRRDSVFGSYEALDVLNILHAALDPGSATAQQTAQQGLLLKGRDATGYDADPTALSVRFVQQGPLACLYGLLQALSGTLLALPDGGRRLSNYWQILELMQNRFTTGQNPAEILDWLNRKISQHDDSDEESGSDRPRLESSADRVRIMTLHQSKGLEFGIVFMPFSAICKKPATAFARYFDGERRCLAYKTALLPEPAQAQVIQEHASENLRLLYVGVTRAKYALWLSWGEVNQADQGPLARLLFAQEDKDRNYGEAVSGFAAAARFPDSARPPPGADIGTAPLPADACNTRQDGWRITSFSGLHRAWEKEYRHAADDEPTAPPDGADTPFKGAAFGNALHAVLEHASPADWSGASTEELPPSATSACRDALQAYGYSQALAAKGAAVLAGLAHNTLHGRLPEQIRLLDLPQEAQRHELEFHLRLTNAGTDRVLALMHRHGYCLQRPHFGFQTRLHGLLTGKIDLLYQAQGRLFILDYKSNLLPSYDPEALRDAMQDNEYDLQYLLYSVAVHRWLTHRLGTAYDYSRVFGGIRYLFSRGMRPGHADGIFSDMPPVELITGLDALFDASEGVGHAH